MKGRISKWMATALALVLLMSSGVMAENVVPAPATGTVSETEVQELNETGVETSAAPEASADPEASAAPETSIAPETSAAPEASIAPEASVAPEANTVLEMNIAPEANTMSTPGDSSATEGCLHQNFVQASTGHWGSQYSDPDAEGHTISTYIVKGYVCQDCGYQWEDEMPEEPSVYREPHSFQNGTCSYCGYKNQCAHANQEIQESREELEYINPTAEGHTVSYYARINRSCLDCGEFFRGARPEEKTTVQETHFYGVDSVCTRCGYECPHLNLLVNDGQLDGKYEKIDDSVHLYSYTPGKNYYCNDCYKSWSEPAGELVSGEEAHRLSDGTCYACGYECPHLNLYVNDGQLDMKFEKIDDYMHLRSYTPGKTYHCNDCYKSWSEPTGEPVSRKEAHDWVYDGTCNSCGAVNVCTHPNKSLMDEYVSTEDDQYVDNGDSGHIIQTGATVQEWFCYDCNQGFEIEIEPVTGVQEPHDYEGGECWKCGHINPCAHKNSYVNSVSAEGGVGRSEGESGHTQVNATVVTERICNDCGDWFTVEEEGDFFEPHVFYEDNICAVCGYENACAHPNAEQYEYYIVTDADSYENAGTEGHYALCIRETRYDCPDCGAYWRETEETAVRRLIPHAFSANRCVCGYVNNCKHENLIIDGIAGAIDTYVEPDAEGHTHVLVMDCNKGCADCGDSLFPTTETQTTREPHEFVDGKCKWCNYVYVEPELTPAPTDAPVATPTPTMPAVTDKPIATPAPTKPAATDKPVVTPAPTEEPVATPAPTDAPVVTPAPVYTQLPENEELHGVKVENELKMGEAVSAVAEELENQGANVQVQLMNVDNVITAEEKTKLETLPLKEQMFTVLSVIGFEDVVNRTLEAEGEALSVEAQALKDEIQARVSAMTEAEYAEFEAMLMENFPQATVVIDGVEYTFFTLELEVRDGDTVRYERYGFRLEGEEWILTRLEVA